MGFWDREVEDNGLDDMFDLNNDGLIDAGEEAMEMDYLDRLINGDSSDEVEEEDDLELYGLDRIDLELMDEAERREALLDAGLDPDDYDFY